MLKKDKNNINKTAKVKRTYVRGEVARISVGIVVIVLIGILIVNGLPIVRFSSGEKVRDAIEHFGKIDRHR